LIADARADLAALQAAGVDAVMFGNENDRPYEFRVDTASTATMAYVIGCLRPAITVPFGVDVLWDPMSTVALAAATGAAFCREIFTGTYASDMGPWTPDAGAALRYRARLHRPDLCLLCNVSAEFADSLDRRPLPDRARSAVFSSIPDAVLVSGQITGEAARMEDLAAVKRALPRTPVLANTGVRHDTVAEVLRIADGCVVGSALKVDGDTWKAVDPERARDFMDRVRAAR
jgi:membrane complex biogenesis BtpA family protein